MMTPKNIFVTESDYNRLMKLIPSVKSAFESLEEELGRAIIVRSDEISPDVVTMRSKIRFSDLDTHEEWAVTLVYPDEANLDEGKISILAPVGSALIGLSAGETIEWPLPNGKTRKLKITQVLYQPEAQGEYHL